MAAPAQQVPSASSPASCAITTKESTAEGSTSSAPCAVTAEETRSLSDSMDNACRHFPWITIDPGPVESVFTTPGGQRQFGMPFTGILPLEPPLHLFLWPPESISRLRKPNIKTLTPAPAAAPHPIAGQFPQAPIYQLNCEPDHSYRRGYRYAAPFHTSDRAVEKERMLNIQMPPNILPVHFDARTRTLLSDPIPGMVRLPMGVPMVHLVNNDSKRAVTAVCGHTLSSLMQYEEGPKVKELVDHLMPLTWGIAPTDTDPGVPGIFELPGMKRNLRSKKVNSLAPGDDSFNLASTCGEGEGSGIFMPAVQTNTPPAAAIIKEVLQILHQLYCLIMPLCISRFKWDMIEFNALENNVIAFANVVDIDIGLWAESPPPEFDVTQGPPPVNEPRAATDKLPQGVHQLHFSTILLAQLRSSIGAQGYIHGDFQDDAIAFTLFVILFRLPPGSNLGPFLWMRGAIYLRETDEYVLFTLFKGRDLHTGSTPTYVKQIYEAWISMDTANKNFKWFGRQIRCGYVIYPSMAGTSHNTQTLYSPSLHFLHSPAANIRDSTRKYYCENDTVLGKHRERANRLGREGLYCLKNFFAQCHLKLGFNVNTLLEHTVYVDKEGKMQKLEPSPLDIEDDDVMASEYFVHWKGYDSAEDNWEPESNLVGSEDLLAEFNSANGLLLLDPQSSDDKFRLPTENPEPRNVSLRTQRLNRLLDQNQPPPCKLKKEDLNKDFLKDLLNLRMLKAQCDDLEASQGVLLKPSTFKLANDSAQTIAETIIDQIKHNNELSTQMYFELLTTASGNWGSRLANLMLACIADMGSSIPDMFVRLTVNDLISQGVQVQEVIRSSKKTGRTEEQKSVDIAQAPQEDKGVRTTRAEEDEVGSRKFR
ncbi:hypothetical protein C8R43DRAFT_1118054 [Mycena crocata]|nr:hypothetical protein C8R43DRAFT_1118054 [Mycena crocata]